MPIGHSLQHHSPIPSVPVRPGPVRQDVCKRVFYEIAARLVRRRGLPSIGRWVPDRMRLPFNLKAYLLHQQPLALANGNRCALYVCVHFNQHLCDVLQAKAPMVHEHFHAPAELYQGTNVARPGKQHLI